MSQPAPSFHIQPPPHHLLHDGDSDQSVSSLSKISYSSALELVDRMGDTLVMGEEDGRKVVLMRESGGLRYSLLLRVHLACNVREEDSHT